MQKIRIAYFGGEPIGVPVLEELKSAGIIPDLVICNPDRPQGRKMVLTPPPTKVWTIENDIEVLQPESLNSSDKILQSIGASDLFLVVGYSQKIPKEILDIPKYGSLNMHPSLLPKFRGASPIRSAILADERETGATIMLVDEKMDHGPIVAQMPMQIVEEKWPLRGRELDEGLARMGGALLASTIPEWIAGNIEAKEQNHDEATFSHKISKADGEINLDDDPYQNLLKIRAFDGWPGTFFYHEHDGKKTRVKITDAELSPDSSLNILKVIPEGKNEVAFSDYIKK